MDNHLAKANWFPMEACDKMGCGLQSFYPRSHLTNTGEAFHWFIRDFLQTYAESYVKSFVKKITATEDKEILLQVKRRDIVKEKLLVCCAIVKRRFKDPSARLDSKKGITHDRFSVGKVKSEEKALLLRPSKQLTDAYIKYLHKEDWYLRLKRKFPQFERDMKLKSDELSYSQMWQRIRSFCKQLIE